ncbi:hypothetical protein G3O06_15290 [Burkholderia sp. Ac-20345]|uniref:hypothetical protein n=1 Tax=Burkholderia sp. Ac-20345 TaxID=2703891 RepID=UPI00197B09F5|nr:hypothetical protein [Burkholderia sp. Ac-20345]MBN3778907.1 hypothetical protein [Burkholderia sp. Ac-20345]
MSVSIGADFARFSSSPDRRRYRPTCRSALGIRFGSHITPVPDADKMHAHASVFTLHRHAQSHIGLALDRREVTSLQRIRRRIAPHAVDGNDDAHALKSVPPSSTRIAASMRDTSDPVLRLRLPNNDAFLKHFLRLQACVIVRVLR